MAITWIGILFCLTQSAMFSGLNLAFFSISKLRLGIEAEKKNIHAIKVLNLRNDSNFLLATILWGNVAVNVLLALLSGSVLAGALAFLFSTVVITIIGEIIPQAYFSRHALNVASILSPVIRFYQVILFPVAKTTSIILDLLLGKEAINYYREEDLSKLISLHMQSKSSDIQKVEGKGAINFLALDDLPVSQEGEDIDPNSIIELKFNRNIPDFPLIQCSPEDDFIKKIESSGKKWIILIDQNKEPRLVLNSDKFIRGALFYIHRFNPQVFCFKPVIIKDDSMSLGKIIPLLSTEKENKDEDVIEKDIIILWGKEKKVLTGSDLFGRLLRGIIKND